MPWRAWWIVACLVGLMPSRTSAAPANRPNVLVILADDLGYGDVRCNNPDRGRIPTPRIDALAAQGVRFTDGHSSSSACSPSRYSLLTGRYHWRTRLQQGIVGMWEAPLIAEERLTIAGLAAQHGYHAACVGKWHLGWDWPIDKADMPLFRTLGGPSGSGARGGKRVVVPTADHLAAWRRAFEQPIAGGPTTRGFAEYFGTDVPNWPPFCFIDNDRTRGIPTTLLPRDQVSSLLATAQGPALPGWKLDEVLPAVTDRACGIIAEQAAKNRPFLLYVALTSPHTPIAVARDWQGRSGLGVPYADFVMQTDAAVGRMLDALDAAGCARDTIVVVTSDNGCETKIGLEELGRQGHFPSGPFRGFKRDVWEGGHRVPFIVRWPAVVASGRVSEETVSSVDLMATFADVLGATLPPDAGEDSVSFVPLLRGRQGPVRESLVHQSYTGVFAIRSGRWKLICGPGEGQPSDEPSSLYDLAMDPAETTNLAAAHPAEVERLTSALDRLVADGRSTPGPHQKNDVAVRIRRGSRQSGAIGEKPRAALEQPRPNVVIMMADDVSWDDIGCYGNPTARTPHIDALAAHGRRFDRAYLTTSSCSPSRASIITGRYPHNLGRASELHLPIAAHVPWFPRLLREAGYFTGLVGKSHMSAEQPPAGGAPQAAAFDVVDRGLTEDNHGGHGRWVHALRERPRDKPFFFWFAAYDAHREWEADREWRDDLYGPPHDPRMVRVPAALTDDVATRADLASFHNEVTRFDHFVGEVVGELRRQEVLDDTLVIVMADNGRPFPGAKTRLNEAGVRTPFVAHWPRTIGRPGAATASLVSAIDIAPTVLAAAGVSPTPTMQGVSFLPVLRDPDAVVRTHVFSEQNWHDYEAHGRAVRSEGYLYIRNQRPTLGWQGPADSVRSPAHRALLAAAAEGSLSAAGRDVLLEPRPTEELYVLADDPEQVCNLVAEPAHAAALARMQRLLDDWIDATHDSCPAALSRDAYDRTTGLALEISDDYRGIAPGTDRDAARADAPGPR